MEFKIINDRDKYKSSFEGVREVTWIKEICVNKIKITMYKTQLPLSAHVHIIKPKKLYCHKKYTQIQTSIKCKEI